MSSSRYRPPALEQPDELESRPWAFDPMSAMHTRRRSPTCRRGPALAVLALALAGASGCAALTNPVADGIPVSRLPDEVLGESREALRPIPLNLLGQDQPEVYRLAAGDILGMVIEGVLGERNAPPPVHMERDEGTPSIGYPIPVREDGTVTLPFIEPIKVAGLTLIEAQELVRKAYTVKKEILKTGTERIMVTLMRSRRYHVLVVREDGGSAGVPAGPQLNGGGGVGGYLTVGASHRGSGTSLDLPAYENDVLNALTRSGGLPGTDAKNEVLVLRKPRRGDPKGTPQVIRIPLRLRPGEPVPFRPEDVVLVSGDTVFVESRESEVFYTAGLLGSGQFPLPRDYDLDVLQAIATIRGPLINGGFSQTLFNSSSTNTGAGNPSPSLVTVLRRTANGGQIPIRVDLNAAFRDPRERLRIQPADIIVLQETPEEAITRYVTQIFRLEFLSGVLTGKDLQGTATLAVPGR
jgi:protein involved in polysaccharide export with SLBB domain